MSFSPAPLAIRRCVLVAALAVFFVGWGVAPHVLSAMQPPPGVAAQPQASPFVDAATPEPEDEIGLSLQRLGLAALFGTALALRPRRRS